MKTFLGAGVLLALLALPNITWAQASNTEGQERNTRVETARGDASLYLGLQGGGHQVTSGFLDVSTDDNVAFNGGLLAGFEYLFPSRIYLALEAYGGLQNYKYDDFRSEYYFGANALLGWRALPGVRFHLFGGPQWMDLRYDGNRKVFTQDPALAGEIANADYEDFALGWRIGGGVALSLLSPNWRARADYSYAETTRTPPLLGQIGVKNDRAFPEDASSSVLRTHLIMMSLMRVF